MILDKEEIRELKNNATNIDVLNLIDTIDRLHENIFTISKMRKHIQDDARKYHALHTDINALANSFEAQGRWAEANEVRGLI